MKINEILKESEGTPEGLPHLTKELLTHIVQQIGTEGAHAVIKSLEWGDGAAKELLKLIKQDLKQDIGMAESVKQRLDKSCWSGYKKQGTKIKGGVRVNNCVPNESVDQGVSEGYGRYYCSTDKKWKTRQGPKQTRAREALELEEKWSQKYKDSIDCSNPKGFSQKAHCAGKNEDINEELERNLNKQFDAIEEMVESLAEEHGVDADVIWEDFESVDDSELYETAAWRRKAGKNKNGGLNAKGVASYRRENPGSKLQTAVTTKPSKLKPGSKAAKRRKSFCARMSGVKGPMKKPNGKPTRKALALRKWNC